MTTNDAEAAAACLREWRDVRIAYGGGQLQRPAISQKEMDALGVLLAEHPPDDDEPVTEEVKRAAERIRLSMTQKGCPWEHSVYARTDGRSPMMKWQYDLYALAKEHPLVKETATATTEA